MTTFIRTSAFDNRFEPYSGSAHASLQQVTSDSRAIIAMALSLLDQIWKTGPGYAKAGIMLSDISSPDEIQPSLFTDIRETEKSDELMRAIDCINRKNGTNTVHFGSQKKERDWFMRQEHHSPSYTTSWADLPTVR